MTADDRSQQVLAVAVTFFVLTWISVSLRLYVRALTKSFGLDDGLMVITQVIFTVYLASQLTAWQHGTGRHKVNLAPEDNRVALMYWFICEILYIVVVTLLKVAVGIFLLRLSVVTSHTWFLRILIAASTLFGSVYFFMVMFQCKPISTFWNIAPATDGLCWNHTITLSLTYTAAALNCAADWAFGILPMFIVWSLNMNTRKKIVVACILGFAAIGSAATIVRMFYIPTVLDSADFLYASTDVAIWSTVEPGIGITAASIATLRPLFKKVNFPKPFFLSSRGKGRHISSNGYIQTSDSHPMERLRPDLGSKTVTISGPSRESEKMFRHQKNHSDPESPTVASITKTVEVSLSRAVAEESYGRGLPRLSLSDLERGRMGRTDSTARTELDDTASTDNIWIAPR